MSKRCQEFRYIIDMNEGRLYAIDNSNTLYTHFSLNSKWIQDTKEAQIFQTPISERMKQMIMQINFEEIQHIFLQNGVHETSAKDFHLRIKILQSILKENPDATLEELVYGFKKPITIGL